MKLLSKNKKSEIILTHDNCVTKIYTTEDAQQRILQDHDALYYLNNTFGHISYNGWNIRTVKLLWVGIDKKSLGMEYIGGSTVSKLDKNDLLVAEYLYGIWLGHYQVSVMLNKDYGLLYTDLSLHNAIMDKKNKNFVVIDPGKHFGRNGYIYEDLIQHCYSISIHCIKRLLNPFKYINQFMNGYLFFTKKKSNIWLYYLSIVNDTKNRIRIRKNNMRSIVNYIIGLVILIPIYSLYIPFYLWYKGSRV